MYLLGTILGEVAGLKVSDDYWSCLSHKVNRLEQSWQLDAALPQVGQANFAPPNRRSTTQDKGETR